MGLNQKEWLVFFSFRESSGCAVPTKLQIKCWVLVGI